MGPEGPSLAINLKKKTKMCYKESFTNFEVVLELFTDK